MIRAVWLVIAGVVLAGCSSSAPAKARSSLTSAPTPSSSSGFHSLGPDGAWTVFNSHLQFDAGVSDFQTPPGAPTAIFNGNSTIADYHAYASAELAACHTFVQRLRTGNWTLSVKPEILRYANELNGLVCPQDAVQVNTTSVAQYIQNAAAFQAADRQVNTDLQTIQTALGD